MAKNQYQPLAEQLIKYVGGSRNIQSVTHCVTRLRFRLVKPKKAQVEAIEGLDQVITVVEAAGQVQVVIGSQVALVFAMVEGLLEEQHVPVGRDSFHLVDGISGVLAPLLGLMAGTGMLRGLLSVLLFFGWVEAGSGFYQVTLMVANGFMTYMPLFIGLTAARKFKMNPYTGMAIGGLLLYMDEVMAGIGSEPMISLFEQSPFATQAYMRFLGIPILYPTNGYGSGVIPIIVIVLLGSRIEGLYNRWVPDVLKVFFVPVMTLATLAPFLVILVGPLATLLMNGVGLLAQWLFNVSPLLAGALMGGLWQVLVMFGLHWGIIPIVSTQLALNGYETLMVPTFAASFAQTAAVLAILTKTKDKQLKAIGTAAAIAGFFGITESAIYGVTLPKKKPFIVTCLVAAFAGGMVAWAGVKAYSPIGFGLFGFTSFIDYSSRDLTGLIWMLFAVSLALVLSYVVTYFIYQEEGLVSEQGPQSEPLKEAKVNEEWHSQAQEGIITSPITGELRALSQVSDRAFASGALGPGIAIVPTQGWLYAPFDGYVTSMYQSLHAIGLTSKDGLEVLIHIGMETIHLEGTHFKAHVQQGQTMKAGQALIEFDLQALKQQGYDLTTPFIVTNAYQYETMRWTQQTHVYQGEPLLWLEQGAPGL